ncbi:MAG: peptidoglycan-associated lipoprotein Pal [Deltaproteobacteria bacterium]|nr:peptidoglycan-associated lipoprotein Pal [Deltaproteobacteria bacterium]
MKTSQKILSLFFCFGIALAGAACQKKGPVSSNDGVDLINIPLEAIHFDFDKYNIRADAQQILSRHSDWLKTNASVNVIIEGNTDEWGTEEYNLALGERRAMAAKTYLVNLGISADRMNTISYGESRPVNPEHNQQAWDQNRRDDFKGRK